MEIERIEKEALEKIKRELHGRSARALSAHIHDVLDKAFADLRAAHEAECEKIRGIVEGRAGDIIGNTREMQEVARQARHIAHTEGVVLVRGGAGTGKEHVARYIHELSDRKARPFTILNCDTLEGNTTSAFEAELFGYERGAFTGATSRHIGKAEQASGGTLFLDEVAELSPASQARLLEFMQGRTFKRLGSNIEQRSDIRIVASTGKNLEALVQQGLFREDLYYRLNIFQINLPDLSQRKTDILLLADHFIEKMNLKYGKNIARLSTPAIDMLMSYHWPGNVRELENCIEHACLATTDVAINAYDLPPTLQTDITSGTALIPEGTASLTALLESYEKEILTEALRRNNGNLSAAGRDISVSPRMMHYKVKKFGL
ncbi:MULTISPECIES: sigma-54-dependent Fis family transcriptional regulator [unclassified Fibrobacter]|uniref:sigma-54 interaction domain-containing protein n=1 Tax=unclassified Fibrobacter TaxID=2634177 RepID=UPI0025C1BF81|nr:MULTISPECIES: sigma-54 dependent transcriptional regulator [unclassified Fibrobacter]